MMCHEIEDLLALEAARVLDEAEQQVIQEHRGACPRCSEVSAELAEVMTALKAPLPTVELDRQSSWDRLTARIDLAGERAEESRSIAIEISLSCRYCHDGLNREEACYCASCLAPHHIDCFRTHGRCTALGCDETFTVSPDQRFAPPPRKRRRFGLIFGALLTGAVGAAAYAGYDYIQKQDARFERELAQARRLAPAGKPASALEVLKQEYEAINLEYDAASKELQSLKAKVRNLPRVQRPHKEIQALENTLRALVRAAREKGNQIAYLEGKPEAEHNQVRTLQAEIRQSEDRIAELNDQLLAEARRFDSEKRALSEAFQKLQAEQERGRKASELAEIERELSRTEDARERSRLLYRRALAKLSQGPKDRSRINDALDDLSAALAITDQVSGTKERFDAAIELQDKRRYNEAIDHLGFVLSFGRELSDEDRARAHHQRGLCLVKTGRFIPGVADFARAVELSPKLFKELPNKAYQIAYVIDTARVVKELVTLTEQEPRSAHLHMILGFFRGAPRDAKGPPGELGDEARRELKLGLASLEKARQLNPRFVAAHLIAGDFQRRLGSYSKAHNDLRQAARLAPDLPYPPFLRALTCLQEAGAERDDFRKTGLLEDAADLLKVAIKLDPELLKVLEQDESSKVISGFEPFEAWRKSLKPR